MPLPKKRVSSNLSNFGLVMLLENFTEFEGLVDNYEHVCGFCKCAVGIGANFK
jgi:hypothetical protein